jgi:hypothetical protein
MALPVLDFPASPAVGDRHPVPVVTGQPQYRWDGTAWLASDAAEDATDVSVAEDQNFTSTQKAQGRENIYAAPFDALSYSGMQINGSMEVSQENGGAVVLANNYPADGWVWAVGTTSGGVTNAQQTLQNPVAGLKNALAITVATAPSGVAAGDWYVLCQRIEGHRVVRLGWGFSSAQPITIGFWTAHNRTGKYSVGITNSAATRAYMTTYTQAAADTWQYNVITIPGCQDGAWLYNNAAGMVLNFSVAMGTTYTAPSANSWLTGQYLAAPGQINGVAATSDFFRLTGVVVLPGIEAPSAERSPLIMRPYDQELVTCKRYYQKNGYVAWSSYAAAAGTPFYMTMTWPVEFRSTPTTELLSPTYANATGVGVQTVTPTTFSLTASSVAAGQAVAVLSGFTGNARL